VVSLNHGEVKSWFSQIKNGILQSDDEFLKLSKVKQFYLQRLEKTAGDPRLSQRLK